MAKAALKKPDVITHESGRKVYVGSLSDTRTELSAKQARQIGEALRDPCRPSDLVATTTGLSPFDPFCGESVRRHLAALHEKGLVEPLEKHSGFWQLTPAGKEHYKDLEEEE
jgi:hypothetical protein